jgi:hypothetical protein
MLELVGSLSKRTVRSYRARLKSTQSSRSFSITDTDGSEEPVPKEESLHDDVTSRVKSGPNCQCEAHCN